MTKRDWVFRIALGLVLLAHVVLLAPGFWLTPLWEDEAYNLTVPQNLLAGLGYTSDGILDGGRLSTFDERISTGPVVLLPIAGVLATGIDPVLGGRLVMAGFAALLIAAAWIVGSRIGGRWAGLAAMTVPAMFDGAAPPSPLQGLTDVLGEVPAAAFLLLSISLLPRRPVLAGLAAGLALQCKLLAVIAVPALALAVLLTVSGATVAGRLRRLLGFGAALAVPTALFELAKLAVLGPAGYVASTRALLAFLRSGGQSGFSVPPGEKLIAFLEAWHLPWWLATAGFLALAAVIGLSGIRRARLRELLPGDRLDRERVIICLAAGAALLTALGWWMLAKHQPPWIRHPSIVILAAGPVVAAWAVFRLSRARLRRPWTAGIAATLAAAMTASVVVHVGDAFTGPQRPLAAQREAAGELASAGQPVIYHPWSRRVSIVFLAGSRSIVDEPPPDAGVPMLLNEEEAAGECGAVLARVWEFRLCEPRVDDR